MMDDYNCDNFSESKCLCHKGKLGCVNLQVDALKNDLHNIMTQLTPEDAKMFCDKLIKVVNDLKKEVSE